MATELTPENLAKLRELAKAATPGNKPNPRVPTRESGYYARRCSDEYQVFGDDDEGKLTHVASVYGRADAAYIAAADPQTVLALVEEVERLRDIETDLLVCDADCRDLTEEVERLRRQRRQDLASHFAYEVSQWSSAKLRACYAQPETVKQAENREAQVAAAQERAEILESCARLVLRYRHRFQSYYECDEDFCYDNDGHEPRQTMDDLCERLEAIADTLTQDDVQ